ncbi:hypothetical protein GSH19_03475 [Lactobacillus sp. S2-2]|uniref:hypothetical protein n=1 Tax=Lactobacillus sp. S2-2 TaxID=2692917 RepID=UPI001F35B655|nr:hypothetical protein [Lactobacillus sp. S2-2]MCF6515214.1 hypothetical protein [Lactobacillus sp. S2-2]
MPFNRVILLDLASFGFEKQSKSFNLQLIKMIQANQLPSLTRLGLFNILSNFCDVNSELTINQNAIAGTVKVQTLSTHKTTGFREMFDFMIKYRAASLFEEVGKYTNTSIIARFANFLQTQENCEQIQVANDAAAFSHVNTILGKSDSGFIYAQLPDLRAAFKRNELEKAKAILIECDHQIQLILDQLLDNDLLIVTSSHAFNQSQSSIHRGQSYLPVMISSPKFTHGKDLGIDNHPGSLGSTVMDAFGFLDEVIDPLPSWLSSFK